MTNTTSRPQKPSNPSSSSPWRRRILNLLQYPLLAAVALAAAYSAAIGQWLILAYAIIVIFTRRSSRLSFGSALFILITIPLFQAINQTGIAENAAIYVYELLVIGTIQALLELRKTTKMHN